MEEKLPEGSFVVGKFHVRALCSNCGHEFNRSALQNVVNRWEACGFIQPRDTELQCYGCGYDEEVAFSWRPGQGHYTEQRDP